MSILPADRRSEPSSPRARVLVVAAPDRALDLLRLATLRSDDVVLVAETVSARASLFAESFAIDVAQRPFRDADLADASVILLSLPDRADENRIVRSARRMGVPVHVVDRPLVSDFTLLALLEGAVPVGPPVADQHRDAA